MTLGKSDDAQLMEQASSAIGALFELFGLKRRAGQIWGVLYLRGQWMDADGVRRLLRISTGTTSMGLNELITLGLAERGLPLTGRQVRYRATTDVWKVTQRVIRKRMRPAAITALDVLENVVQKLGDESSAGTLIDQERILHLVDLGRFAIDLGDAFMERTRVELKAARQWLRVSEKLGGEPLSRLRKRINRDK